MNNLNKYKICVYAICKNEEKFVDRWMNSMSEADVIVVLDTGSTDGTVEKLRKKGAVVYIKEIKPWRFDIARNISLDYVPNDIDICICTDLDEVFADGWRQCLENAWKPNTTTGRYIFNWSVKENGTPGVQLNYFKVHNRFDYKWVYPVHECLKYIGNSTEEIIFVDGMTLNHYPDNEKSRSSYLPLLELAVKETPEDDRVTHYLGREYMYKEMWDKCIETCKKHLLLKSSQWNEERCASMRWIAFSYFKLSNIREAYCWYYRAIAEAPLMRDAYVEFAKMTYLLSDWATTFHMVEEASKINNRSLTYINMDYAWDFTVDDLGAISCYWLGMYDKALSYGKKALEYLPNDKRLIENIRQIQGKLTA